MHKLLSIPCILMLGLAAGQAQSVNIATWMVELPEMYSTNATNRAAEFAPVLTRVADALKPLNADVILLHGIPSRTTTKQLTDLLRPRVYHNPLLSVFRKNPQSSKIVEPSITMLSRKQPVLARTIEWRTVGAIEAPGGFSVAVFNHGTNGLFVYIAQFPKVIVGMTREQEAVVPRYRELAARYLMSHLDWLLSTATNSGKFVYLATDLEMEGTTVTNDLVVRILHENGFMSSSGTRSLVASTALSSTGWPPEGALVSAFVRGTEFPGDPESIGARSFFAPVALVDLDLRPLPSPPAPVLAGKNPVARPVTASSATVPPTSTSPAAPSTNRGPESVAAAASQSLPPVASAVNPAVSTAPASNPSSTGPSVSAAPGSGLTPAATAPAPHGRWVSWAENRTVVVGGVIAAVFLLILTLLLRSGGWPASRPLIGAGASRPALPPAARRLAQLEGSANSSSIHVLEPPEDSRIAPLRSVHGGPPGSETATDAESESGRSSKSSSWPFLHLLRERMVRWLAAERSQLLSSHHAGAEQVLELEERLTRIQDQFESRLQAREKRISELEAELLTKERSIADLEQTLTGRDRRN